MDKLNLTLVADGQMATVELVKQVLSSFGAKVRTELGNQFYDRPHAIEELAGLNFFLVRPGDYPSKSFVSRLIASRRTYIYYLDDNFWLLLGEAPIDKHYQNPHVRQVLEMAISNASAVICHSKLAAEFLRQFNKRVVVIPAHFDFSVLSKDIAHEVSDEVRIGIVGTSSRADDNFFPEVVRRVLSETPENVVFEFFGHTPTQLAGLPRVRSLAPISDYRAFMHEQQRRGWRLALAPLVDSPFSRYKTNNKFREFGGCGLPAIYSDTPIYKDSVEQGKTGWVVANGVDAWVSQIKWVIEHPTESAQVGLAAHAAVKRAHDLESIKQKWAAIVHSVYRETFVRKFMRRWAIRRMRKWDEVPVTSGQSFLDTGPATPPMPGEKQGYFRRNVVFDLRVGQSIQTTIKPLLPGRMAYSCVVGTNTKKLTGTLKVEILRTRQQLEVRELDFSSIDDNQILSFFVETADQSPLTFRVTNGGSDSIALYALSRASKATYVATNLSFPHTFLV